jgi:hypothetical protein
MPKTDLSKGLTVFNTWLIRVFATLWVLFIALDYFFHSHYFAKAVSHFQYWDLLIVLVLVSAGLIYVQRKNQFPDNRFEIRGQNGVMLYLYLLLFQVLIFVFYSLKVELFTGDIVNGILHFLLFALATQAGLFLIVLSAFAYGTIAQRFFQFPLSKNSKYFGLMGLGFAFLTFFLFIAGYFHFLNPIVAGIIVFVPLVIGFRQSLDFIRQTLVKKSKPIQVHPLALLGIMVILVFVAMNLTAMMRPMPMGFDSMNLYMNTPNLIGQYEGLTRGGQAYNWSIVMSLGFVLFDSTSFALSLSIFPGILSILVLYKIARLYLNVGSSLLSSALFYTIPVMVWQSTFEAKIDLALLFFSLTALLVFLDSPKSEECNTVSIRGIIIKRLQGFIPDYKLWIFIGILLGFAFGIKYTAFFVIIGFGVLAFYRNMGKWGAITGYFMAFAFVIGLSLYKFSTVELSNWSWPFVSTISMIIGLSIFFITSRHQSGLFRKSILTTILMMVFAGIAFFPWASKHLKENRKISVASMMTGKGKLPQIGPGYTSFRHRGVSWNILNEKIFQKNANDLLAQVMDNQQEENLSAGQVKTKERTNKQAKKNFSRIDPALYEEMVRYLGFEKGALRYVSLPYDMTMRNNVDNFAVDIGFLLLMFIPLLMFSGKQGQLLYNLLKIALLSIVLSISIYGFWYMKGIILPERILENLQQQMEANNPFLLEWIGDCYLFLYGIFLGIGSHFVLFMEWSFENFIYMALIISFLFFYLLYKSSFSYYGNKIKYLLVFTGVYFMVWLILGSGVPWYGLLGLALGPVIVVYALQNKHVFPGNHIWLRYLGFVMIGVWLAAMLFLRMTNVNPIGDPEEYHPFDKSFSEYRAGLKSGRNVVNEKIGFYLPVLNELNRNTDYILRSGTFMNYFINRNDERVYIDNQLNLFQYLLDRADDDPDQLIAQFRKYKIRYMVISWKVSDEMTSSVSQRKEIIKDLLNILGNRKNPPIRLVHFEPNPETAYAAIEILKENP